MCLICNDYEYIEEALMAECGCKPKDEYLHLDPEVDSTACQYAEVLRQRDRWLKVVADCNPVEYYGTFDSQRCFFCGNDFYEHRTTEDPDNHKPDCEWIEAREALSTPQQEVKK